MCIYYYDYYLRNAQLVAGKTTTLLFSPRQRLKACYTQCLYNCLLLLWCFSICAVIFACCSMLASPADRSHAWQPHAPLVFEPAGSKVATAPSQCSWARIWNPWRNFTLLLLLFLLLLLLLLLILLLVLLFLSLYLLYDMSRLLIYCLLNDPIHI